MRLQPYLGAIKLRSMLNEVWFYEDGRGIEIYLSAQLVRSSCDQGKGIHFRISRQQLNRTIARLNGERKRGTESRSK